MRCGFDICSKLVVFWVLSFIFDGKREKGLFLEIRESIFWSICKVCLESFSWREGKFCVLIDKLVGGFVFFFSVVVIVFVENVVIWCFFLDNIG